MLGVTPHLEEAEIRQLQGYDARLKWPAPIPALLDSVLTLHTLVRGQIGRPAYPTVKLAKLATHGVALSPAAEMLLQGHNATVLILVAIYCPRGQLLSYLGAADALPNSDPQLPWGSLQRTLMQVIGAVAMQELSIARNPPVPPELIAIDADRWVAKGMGPRECIANLNVRPPPRGDSVLHMLQDWIPSHVDDEQSKAQYAVPVKEALAVALRWVEMARCTTPKGALEALSLPYALMMLGYQNLDLWVGSPKQGDTDIQGLLSRENSFVPPTDPRFGTLAELVHSVLLRVPQGEEGRPPAEPLAVDADVEHYRDLVQLGMFFDDSWSTQYDLTLPIFVQNFRAIRRAWTPKEVAAVLYKAGLADEAAFQATLTRVRTSRATLAFTNLFRAGVARVGPLYQQDFLENFSARDTAGDALNSGRAQTSAPMDTEESAIPPAAEGGSSPQGRADPPPPQVSTFTDTEAGRGSSQASGGKGKKPPPKVDPLTEEDKSFLQMLWAKTQDFFTGAEEEAKYHHGIVRDVLGLNPGFAQQMTQGVFDLDDLLVVLRAKFLEEEYLNRLQAIVTRVARPPPRRDAAGALSIGATPGSSAGHPPGGPSGESLAPPLGSLSLGIEAPTPPGAVGTVSETKEEAPAMLSPQQRIQTRAAEVDAEIQDFIDTSGLSPEPTVEAPPPNLAEAMAAPLPPSDDEAEADDV
jgi:hypothetical protein